MSELIHPSLVILYLWLDSSAVHTVCVFVLPMVIRIGVTAVQTCLEVGSSVCLVEHRLTLSPYCWDESQFRLNMLYTFE